MEEEHIKMEKKEIFLVTSLIIGVLLLLVLTTVRNERIRQQSQAQTPAEIGVQVLSPLSDVEISGNTASVDLRTENQNGTQVLYDAQAQGEAAIFEFMDKNPVVDVAAVSDNMQVKGASTDPQLKRVLPTNFRQNSVLSRSVNDRMNKNRTEVKHYYYTQKIADLPVLGSSVRFDLAQNDKIVGIDGEYTNSTTVSQAKITDQQAIEKAIARASDQLKQIDPQGQAVVCPDNTATRGIYNGKLLNLSSDDTNKMVLEVTVCVKNDAPGYSFKHLYVVSLDDGNILTDSDQIYQALNRNLYNCKTVSCAEDRYGFMKASRVSRAEGQAPISDTDTNKSYDILGDIYNYYFSSFQRDSYNNAGASLDGYVHANVANAQWDGQSMSANSNYIGKDIWAHELTHAVTGATSKLGRHGQAQGRALNESISDMFGYLVDSANWTMGETSRAGAIRDISQPRRYGQPERIFDSNFRCTGEAHLNNGPSNKAFYLMTAGGTFNGCTINGIGKEKSGAIIYKTDTQYLTESSGFFDFNNKVNQACSDLYGASSSECANVKAALQATELDQDRCGAGKTRSTPICAGGTQPTVGPTAAATNTPVPTSITTPVPTGPGDSTIAVIQLIPHDNCVDSAGDVYQRYADFVCSNGFKGTVGDAASCKPQDYLQALADSACAHSGSTTAPSPTPQGGIGGTNTNPNPTSAQSSTPPTATPALGVGYSAPVLNLLVRFQGIEGGPDRNGGNMVVKVGVVGGALDMPITQYVRFQADTDGTFYGKATFPLVVPGKNYCVLIKGPLHIQKKICSDKPLEPRTGEYKRGNSTIAITQGDNDLDFSGIKMLVGDVDQNGVVNSFDLLYVRNAIGSTATVDIERCDVNWDNACNGQDYALMVAALSVKTDDE